ncbi:hypothetical protein [Prosthecochloris ethylica]|nr:hypothetical protein [Prosthecochloris ethylica]
MTAHAARALHYLAWYALADDPQKLLSKARTSFEHLGGRYEGFLKQQGLSCWQHDDHESEVVCRRFTGVSDRDDRADFFAFTELSAEKFANTQVSLIRHASGLMHSISGRGKRRSAAPLACSSTTTGECCDTLLC